MEPCALLTTRKITSDLIFFASDATNRRAHGAVSVSVVSQRAPLTETSSYLR